MQREVDHDFSCHDCARDLFEINKNLHYRSRPLSVFIYGASVSGSVWQCVRVRARVFSRDFVLFVP